MFEKVVTKLWQGRYVSVRDYEIDTALARGGMIIHFEGNAMALDIGDLTDIKNSIPPNSKIFKSKTGGRSYRLVDVPWKLKSVNQNPNQEELFNV